jgi:pilus assembly protein CpaB
MKRSRLLVLVIALAAGGIAAWLASGGRQQAPAPAPPPPPVAIAEVLVAKADLDTGHVIQEGDIGWQAWPAASANSHFVRKSDRPDAIKDFAGATVRSAIVEGEPIRDSNVVLAKGSGFLAAILPRGMRAVSVDIAPDTDAGGFILPNDHVDVLLTLKEDEKTNFATQTLLTNVRVLAIDQTIGEKDGQKVIIGKTATVEVTPQQASKLAAARQLGTVSLALRSLLDSQSPTPGPEEAEQVDHGVNLIRYGVSSRR